MWFLSRNGTQGGESINGNSIRRALSSVYPTVLNHTLNDACDYFGPYKVKITKNKIAKHYGVLFTCLNTRAVHLEAAMDLTTIEFLQALRRVLAI